MKNVIKPLAKRILIPLGLTAAASAAGAGIQKKKNLGSGTTTLIISNDEMKDVIKIVKFLEDSGWLLKGVSETVQNEAKKQKRWFLSMILGVSMLLIVLSLATGSVSIASFATVIEAPVGIISASFSLAFLFSTVIIRKLLKATKNKKKKHNKIVMLARSKLNSIESKISEALITNEISHENLAIINKEKKPEN